MEGPHLRSGADLALWVTAQLVTDNRGHSYGLPEVNLLNEFDIKLQKHLLPSISDIPNNTIDFDANKEYLGVRDG
ncbi:hypothetical protein RRG08_032378 [Elysia crispata]|uniref:Uncharacterized protein n=1 Tax=Elysia crispata TaxID=231223 RepID=A0AAE1AIK9_9GAST|nr:hypothetical protein RRG08_032378 [Elysia crispata]